MRSLIVIVIAIALFFPLICQASLSQTDHDSLWAYFDTLSTGWVPYAVDGANGILANPSYYMPDYLEFYQEYFSQGLITSGLAGYLGYPTYYWFDDSVHYKLQESLRVPALNTVDSIWFNNIDSLALSYFSVHESERTAVGIYLSNLYSLCNISQSVIPDTSKDAIINKVTSWIELEYPQFFLHSVTLDPEFESYLPAYRWQLEAILVDFEPLTPERIGYLSNLFDLQGMYDIVFTNHKVILEDNNAFDNAQLTFIDEYFINQPDEISNLRFISQAEALYTPSQPHIGVSTSSAVNVFGCEIGLFQENEFPGDIGPVYTDVFCIVVAHEVNHVVDAYYLSNTLNPDLYQNRQMLLQAAGVQDSMYLRTWAGSGLFFQEAPQEFIASIANQWFDDSQHTMELGISRFERGWQQPINQALFFCEIYSVRSDTTLFYRIPPTGEIFVWEVPVGRDSLGRINQVTFPTGEEYNFTLSPAGFVTTINGVPGPPPQTLLVPSQYPTITEALSIAQPSDTVLVSSGIYYEHLLLPPEVILMGELDIEDPTIVDGEGGGVVINCGVESQVCHMTIRNADQGVKFYSSSGLVSNCSFEDHNWEAVKIDNSSVTICFSIFSNNNQAFICVNSTAIIDSNSIVDCSGDGIQIHGGNITISNNTIDSTGSRGINVFNEAELTIIFNEISNTGLCGQCGEGILDWDGATSIISGNTIYNTQYTGIGWYGNCEIRDNTIYLTGSVAISLYSDTAIVNKNTIYDIPTNGIVINNSFSQIDSNVISNCTGNSIMFNGSSSGSCNSNEIRYCNRGIYITGTSVINVKGNLIVGSDYDGVYLSSDSAIVQYCTIDSSGFNGIKVFTTGVEIIGNIITHSLENGIYSSAPNLYPNIRYNNLWENNQNFYNCTPDTGNIFLDPEWVGGTPFDYHLQSTSPCIDAGDPISPRDPDSTRADIGAFYFDQGPILPITVTLTPYNPPIQIPANGGTFEFNIAVTNNDSFPATFDIWTMVTLPNGSEYGPIINVPNFTTPPNWSGDRDRTQAVPTNAPAGNYTYDAYVGNYPNAIWNQDHFDFEKLTTTNGGLIIDSWDNWGEEFEDLLGATATLIPEEYAFHNAYPNPFNPITNFQFDLPEAGKVKLLIYNIQGQQVAKLVDNWYSAGVYHAKFDASLLSSGIYFARLQAGEFAGTQKLLLIK